jgi:CHAT domain-containing protein/tetratricopeptide (TPR) repeat protein
MPHRLLSSLVFACALVPTTPALQAVAGLPLADSRVVQLTDQAQKVSKALRTDEAVKLADDAIVLAEQLGDQVGLALAYRAKGIALFNGSREQDSVSWYERALSGFERLNNPQGMAYTLVGLVAVTDVLGEHARSRDYGTRALAVFETLDDPVGRARLLSNLIRTGFAPERHAQWTREVGEIAERHNLEDLRASALRMQGADRFNAGDLAGARTAYETALQLYEQLGDVEALAALYLNLGRVFRAHGDYDGALVRYQKAIDLLAPTKSRYTLVEAVNSSAVALGLLNRHKDALAAYERGLAFAKESGNQRLIDFMEGNLAGGLLSSGEHARAIPLLEAAIARKPEMSLLGFRYNQLALGLTTLGRAPEALAPLAEAVRIARETKNMDSLAPRLANRAWAYTELGRLEDALTDMRETIALTEQTRSRLVPSDFLKRGYGERSQHEYLKITEILSRLGRGEEALEYAERSRGRAFLDLLAARDSTSTTPASQPIATTAGSARDVASTSTGTPLDLAGIRQLAARLKTSVLTYAVHDEATLIWVLRPDASPVHVRVPITRERLAALVSATTAPLRDSTRATTTRGDETSDVSEDALTALPMRGLGLLALSRDDKTSWRELYKTLIDPVRARLPARGGRVTIIPHGPLFQLSFAALHSPAGRYLIEDYELHYAPAASALEFTGRRQQAIAGNASGPWAIVGNPATLPVIRDRPLSPLPGAAEEIASIATIAPRGRALRLDGAGADEAALARTLASSRPSVLHFATHGFVFDDPKTPPFLALNRRGKTDADDGRLTLDEVYGLHLTTDLVVLSACRTGSGQVGADGVVGLARGFFYAGTPSVVATFWDVTDQATSILMSGFYRNYVKTRTKGSSLRSAQLALLADLRAGKVVVTAAGRRVTLPEHPLLWAAFFLSGEP